MGKIIVLDELTSCQIAAGEVVERPASVVKEMAENSLDAGATRISVEIRSGGIKFIKIEDNGAGMAADDCVIAFDKHATSKIRSAEDLFEIHTLGFRGEALASIAAVSKVTLRTKTKDATVGTQVVMEGGDLISAGECGCPDGTVFTVENLFYNTPARFKFLKKDQTEASYVAEAVERMALAHPEVSFRLISDRKQIVYTPGDGDRKSAVYGIFGREAAGNMKDVEYSFGGITVRGLCGTKELSYGNRNRQITFVNGRYVKSKILISAIDEAYKTLTMKGKFPVVILDVSLPPTAVDVNVHPAKTEVRFADDNNVFRAVYHGLYAALFETQGVFAADNPAAAQTPSSALQERGSQCPEGSFQDVLSGLPKKDIFPKKEEFPTVRRYDDPDFLKKDPEKKPVETQPVDLFDSAPTYGIGEERHALDKKPEETGEKKEERGNIFENTKKPAGDPVFENTKKPAQENIFENTQSPAVSVLSAEDLLTPKTDSAKKSVNEPDAQRPGEALKSEGESRNPLQNGTLTEPQNDTRSTPRDPDFSDENTMVYSFGRVIGVLFQTYILLEFKDALYLLDQHAAHERLMFEKIKAALEKTENDSQPLLLPVTVQLTASEYQKFGDCRESLTNLGFEIDDFGVNTLIVRSVPTLLSQVDCEEFLITAIGGARPGENRINVFPEHTVYTMACKAAIKANQKLSDMEVRGLLDQLLAVKNPGTCPHGRPILTKMTKYEVERKFHRA